MKKPRTLILLTDEAITSETCDLDGLDFGVYANVLSSAVVNTQGPFTIGVYGEWGTGKTSLLHMIKKKCDEEKKVTTIWFNAWRYERDTHPIVPLVGTIIRGMEKSGLKKNCQKLLNALRAVAYGFSGKATVKIPGLAEVEAAFVAKDMIEREENLSIDPLLDKSLYYNAFEKLSSASIKDHKIIVFIDDLDRCFPDMAINLLESIKLVLSQPGISFVLGVSRDVIEGYLQHRYRSSYGLPDFDGKQYLDKIVQLPFYIPSHKVRMVEFSKKILARVDSSFKDEMAPIIEVISPALRYNPRAIIRFVNNLMIDFEISNSIESETRAPIAYFAVTRCLQYRWPDVFQILSQNDDLCNKASGWEEDNIYESGEIHLPEEVELSEKMVERYGLKQLLFSDIGRDWLREDVLRIASMEFLENMETKEDSEFADGLVLSYIGDSKDMAEIREIMVYLELDGIKLVRTAASRRQIQSHVDILFIGATSKLSPLPRTIEVIVYLEGAIGEITGHSQHSFVDFRDGFDSEKVRKLARYIWANFHKRGAKNELPMYQ